MRSDARTERTRFLAGRSIRRIVVKLGSGTVTDAEEGLRETVIRGLAAQVETAWAALGVQVVVVSSGAIAAGRKKLGMTGRPKTMPEKQAAAAVGQTSLMRAYERAFEKRGRNVGQLLLTHDDFDSRERYVNARNTIETLLAHGIVPIVNENDPVATQEIKLGDNDHLAALVSQMIRADLLMLLTDSGGLYTKDPHVHPDAERIPVLAGIDDNVTNLAGASRKGSVGTGGMGSKLSAARLVTSWGTPAMILPGLSRTPILDALSGEDVGTLVLPKAGVKARSRKMWIAHAKGEQGAITVDDGARRVLLGGGKSLLPAGIVAVEGSFHVGDAVSLRDPKGRVFARGIAAWDATQVANGMGKKSAEVRALLGDDMPAEVVHRDDLTILPVA